MDGCFEGDLLGVDDAVSDCAGSGVDDWLVEALGLLDGLVPALVVGLRVGFGVGLVVGVFVGATAWAVGLTPGADRLALPFHENATYPPSGTLSPPAAVVA